MNFLQCLRKSIERVKMWTMKNFATKKYVDEKIETVDLSAYATTDYVDENFATQRSVDEKLTAYATKKDIALLGEDADIPTAYSNGTTIHSTMDGMRGSMGYIFYDPFSDAMIESTGGNFRIALYTGLDRDEFLGYAKPLSIRYHTGGDWVQAGYYVYVINPIDNSIMELRNSGAIEP